MTKLTHSLFVPLVMALLGGTVAFLRWQGGVDMDRTELHRRLDKIEYWQTYHGLNKPNGE